MNWNTEIKKKKWIIAFDFKERYEKEDIGKKNTSEGKYR